jgi:hypothetical protein
MLLLSHRLREKETVSCTGKSGISSRIDENEFTRCDVTKLHQLHNHENEWLDLEASAIFPFLLACDIAS